MRTRSGDKWRQEELDILRAARTNRDAHDALLAAGYERTLTTVANKRSGVVPTPRRVSSGKAAGISLVMRPDWPPVVRRRLAALAELADSGMPLSTYDRERARILEGYGS